MPEELINHKVNPEASTAGRKTKYRPGFNRIAAQACLLGATNDQLAVLLEVAVSTINLWKLEHPLFSDAIRKSKLQADSSIAASLYKRGLGYTYKEVKIEKSGENDEITKTTITTKHLPADVAACIFWLKNRQPDLWRERHEQVISAGENVEFNMYFSGGSDSP